MPMTNLQEWQQWALAALVGAAILTLLFNLPYVGRVFRALVSFGVLALALFLLIQQAPYDPRLAWLRLPFGIDRQQVAGDEVRIPMSADGHFWADVRLNGVPRRMLVDSGATVTALSQATADAAGVADDKTLVPVMVRTANGIVQARTGLLETMELGPISAQRLRVVVSPTLNGVDVLGMNFLSELESWRVEGRTLILTPGAAEASPAPS